MTAWEDVIDIGGLGTTGARVVGIILAGLWLVMIVHTGRFRKPHSFHLVFYLFVVWSATSALWSLDFDVTAVRVLTYIQLVGMVLIIWSLYNSPGALRAGLQAYVLGAWVAIVGTVANYVSGTEASYLRYAASGFNVNKLGFILALGIPVAWHLAVTPTRSKIPRALQLANYAYLPAAYLAIMLGGSRTALVAALLSLPFVLGSIPRLGLVQRTLILAALISAIFALQSLVPQSSLRRLASTGTSILELDVGGRVQIWREGISLFSEHPLLGIGAGMFRQGVESAASAHNSFLSVLVGLGLIGFALFVTILAIVINEARRAPNARFWLTVLLVWAAGASVGTLQIRKQTWLFLNFAVVASSLAVRRHAFRSEIETPVTLHKLSGAHTARGEETLHTASDRQDGREAARVYFNQ